ncbi:hypothetical protein ABBQ32_003615 [Trebouxia sp. C0010 RCD-2024]
MHLVAIKLKPHSNIEAVWQCNKCPAGQLHLWTAAVGRRTNGSQCPYCSNKRVCLHNSLATIAPEAAKYRDYSKNLKTSGQVLAGSGFKAEWKCPACQYEWRAQIAGRTTRRAGCPRCSTVGRKQNSHPTFAGLDLNRQGKLCMTPHTCSR